MKALADTSVWVAVETNRRIDTEALPDEMSICVITLAELEAGVHAATDTMVRSNRLATLAAVSQLEALPIDRAAARQWAALRVRLHEANRRVNVNDLWIASIALANGLPVVTQDGDFDVMRELGLLDVISV